MNLVKMMKKYKIFFIVAAVGVITYIIYNNMETFKVKLKLLLNNKLLFSKKYPLVKSGELIHNLTHFKLKISYYRLDYDYFSIKNNYLKWISNTEIDKYTFPKFFFKSLKFIYA